MGVEARSIVVPARHRLAVQLGGDQSVGLPPPAVHVDVKLRLVPHACRREPDHQSLASAAARPGDRSLLIPQVGLRVPYVWNGLTDLLHEPGNPIRFYSLLWFSFYSFVAVPISVVLGSFKFSL